MLDQDQRSSNPKPSTPDVFQVAESRRRFVLDEINVGVNGTADDSDGSLSLREQFFQAATQAGMTSAQTCESWLPVADAVDQSARIWGEAAAIRRIGGSKISGLCLEKVRRSDELLETARRIALELIATAPTGQPSPAVMDQQPVPDDKQSDAAAGAVPPRQNRFDRWNSVLGDILTRLAFGPKGVEQVLQNGSAAKEAPKAMSEVATAKSERPKLLDQLNELRDQFRELATAEGVSLSAAEMIERWQPVFTAQDQSSTHWLEAQKLARGEGVAFSGMHTGEEEKQVLLSDQVLREAIGFAEAVIAALPKAREEKVDGEIGDLLARSCGVPGYVRNAD